MNTWAPLFSKIVDSSIWDEPDWVVKVFLTMLAKKDRDHVVRANAYMIGMWSRKDEKTVLEALKVLASPDKRRLEPQPFEGRRIEKVEEGWLVLNGEKYRQELSAAATRERKRIWAQGKRAQRKAAKNGQLGTKNLPAEAAAYERKVDEHGPEPKEAGAHWEGE